MSDFREIEKAFLELKRRIAELERREIVRDNFEAASAPAVTDDSSENYSVGSRWIVSADLEQYICLDNTEGAAVWHKEPKNNFAATTSPGVNDDDTDGYSAGSMWINTAMATSYICLDASTGAADWNMFTTV